MQYTIKNLKPNNHKLFTKQLSKMKKIILVGLVVSLLLLVGCNNNISEKCRALSKEDKIVCKSAFKEVYVSEELCSLMSGNNLCKYGEQPTCRFTIEQHYPSGEILRGNNSFLITEHPKLIIYFTNNTEVVNYTEEIYWYDISDIVLHRLRRLYFRHLRVT